jgi:hypothetical protein
MPKPWTGLAIAAAATLAVAACGADSGTRGAPAAAVGPPAPDERPRGVREDCSTRSEATFPGAYTDPGNLVAGPLSIVRGDYTPASTIHEFGGDKFPVLVRAGHRVTVALSRRTRRHAGLAYGPLPQGEIRLADTHRVVTFRACREQLTFWMGFVVVDSPRCVPLWLWIDDERAPRRAVMAMGVRDCD